MVHRVRSRRVPPRRAPPALPRTRFRDKPPPARETIGAVSLDLHRRALQTFFDLDDASRVAFDDVDGHHFEGYALEVEADRVLVGLGGPLAPATPRWFRYDSLRRDALFYWSAQAAAWQKFELPEGA